MHKILIVEDDPHTRDLAESVLDAAGLDVYSCGTVDDGLKSLAVRAPDLVLSDIGLPDGSGIKICQEVKSGALKDVPVIFMTAQGDLKTRIQCFQAGAQDYIPKPFAIEELAERVRVHLQLKISRDSLIKKNYELELRKRAKQDLADMIIHDMRSPLTSIQGTLDLIGGNHLISKTNYDNLVSHAGVAAKFMLLMLNDLLDISQTEQTSLKTEIAALNVPLALERVKDFFTTRCNNIDVTLKVTSAVEIKTLVTDQNLLFRIIANLISNSLRVTQKGGAIELECTRSGDNIRFMVSDRGPGVSDQDKKKIFQKFTTDTSNATIEDRGVGIGLTFCLMAATALKGRIWVEDRKGGGSLFILELPAISA